MMMTGYAIGGICQAGIVDVVERAAVYGGRRTVVFVMDKSSFGLEGRAELKLQAIDARVAGRYVAEEQVRLS